MHQNVKWEIQNAIDMIRMRQLDAAEEVMKGLVRRTDKTFFDCALVKTTAQLKISQAKARFVDVQEDFTHACASFKTIAKIVEQHVEKHIQKISDLDKLKLDIYVLKARESFF